VVVVEAEVKAVGIGDQGGIKAPDVWSQLSTMHYRTTHAEICERDIGVAFAVVIVLIHSLIALTTEYDAWRSIK